jgi:hypothetical protein
MGMAITAPYPETNVKQCVIEILRRHWVKPVPPQTLASLSSQRIDHYARAALDVILTRQYRVGPLPEPLIYQELLERVRFFVAQGKPITITVGYGPLKNQNAVPYSAADWAEFFALTHLASWHNKVQKVYPPGLTIQIVFDDTTLVMANHADKSLMRSYMSSIAGLIKALGYESIFHPPFAQSRFSWIFLFGMYLLARWRVWQWERHPSRRALIERMDQAAARNLVLPANLTPKQHDKAIRKASHRYRVYWEALQLSGITRSKKRIIAMYLDGNQHHIRQMVALHLTTLDKGQVTQPWQGEGVLMDNGHGKWEPCVLTAGRRQRSRTTTINNLDLISFPGFDQIKVAFSRQPSTHQPIPVSIPITVGNQRSAHESLELTSNTK